MFALSRNLGSRNEFGESRLAAIRVCLAGLLFLNSFAYSRLRNTKGWRHNRYNTVRIIGGEDAPEDKYPFAQVSIKYPNGQHMCGASLISPELVLTAAHCMAEGGSVEVGKYDFANPSDSYEVFAKLRSFVHPMYDSVLFRYDMAVIQLHQPVQENFTFTRLNNDTSLPLVGQDVLVLGWGATKISARDDDKIFPDVMQETTVEVISNQRCAAFEISGTSLYDGEIYPEMVCAWTQGTDACSGDSGGPLIATTSGSVSQVGVVSWGRGCALYPGVYSRVSSGYEWIRSVVCTQSTSPPSYLGCVVQDVQNASNGDVVTNPGVDDGSDWNESDVNLSSTAPSSVYYKEPSLAPTDASILQTSASLIAEIQLDAYSWETGWFLAFANGTKLAEFGIGTYTGSSGARIRETITISNGGSYTFGINDSGGNGLCCKDENGTVGWYRLYMLVADDQDSTLVYGAGNFGYGEERVFEVSSQDFGSKTNAEVGILNKTTSTDLTVNRTTVPVGLSIFCLMDLYQFS